MAHEFFYRIKKQPPFKFCLQVRADWLDLLAWVQINWSWLSLLAHMPFAGRLAVWHIMASLMSLVVDCLPAQGDPGDRCSLTSLVIQETSLDFSNSS